MSDDKKKNETLPTQNNITQDGHPAAKAEPETEPTTGPTTGPTSEPTTDQLRSDIDEGRTGDKVGYTDPASAPLGTDAEAGGASPTSEEVARARAQETARRDAPTADTGRPVTSEREVPAQSTGTNKNLMWGVIAAVVVVLLLVLLF